MSKHYITEPPCAFVEAVVAGYSPVSELTCRFARIAAKMRASAWWSTVPDSRQRGEVRRVGVTYLYYQSCSGVVPWR